MTSVSILFVLHVYHLPPQYGPSIVMTIATHFLVQSVKLFHHFVFIAHTIQYLDIFMCTVLLVMLLRFVFRSFLHLGAGLSVGFSGLAAGFAIGIVGDAGVRGTAQQPRLFVGMILILIFAEVLGLYGLIVALVLSTKGG